MKDGFDQQDTWVNLEQAIQQAFPTVLTNRYVYLPEDLLWARTTDRHFQVEIVCDNHLPILRQPQANEVAHYGLKPVASCPLANLLSFLAVNDHLWTAFAKQSLAMPVLDNALMSGQGNDYHLVVKLIDQHHNQMSLEPLAKALLNQHAELSWEGICQRLTTHLPSQQERLQFLKQLLYRVFIDCENHPQQFVILNQGRQAKIAPFSGVIPKGAYGPIYERYPENRALAEWANQTPVSTPQAFWQLVTVMNVNLAMFKEVERDMLSQWTQVLPEYLKQLQPLIQGVRFKKSLVPQGGSRAQTWTAYLKRQHQQRVKDLEAQGWYADLNLPAPARRRLSRQSTGIV